jgi:hypothetical protein
MQKSIAIKIQRLKMFLPQTSLLRFEPAGMTTCRAQLPLVDIECVHGVHASGFHARTERLERFGEGHFGNYGL